MYTIVIFIATDINENKYRIELRLGFDCSTEMLDSHAFTLYSSIFSISMIIQDSLTGMILVLESVKLDLL